LLNNNNEFILKIRQFRRLSGSLGHKQKIKSAAKADLRMKLQMSDDTATNRIVLRNLAMAQVSMKVRGFSYYYRAMHVVESSVMLS